MPKLVVNSARLCTRSGASLSLYFPLVALRSGGAAVMSVSLLDIGSAALCTVLLPRGISIEPLHFFPAYSCRAQPCLAPFFPARFGAPHTAADRERNSHSGNR